jgi:tetratricopeptide (TPR) repeat protein
MGKASKKKKSKKTVAAPKDIPEAVAFSSTPPWIASIAFHLILIAVLGLLAYSNTFDVPFQWDHKYGRIVGNPVVKDLSYFIKPSKAIGLENYIAFKGRYIGYLTFALNYKLHGFNVTGYHIFNLAVHILNTILVYFLVLLTFGTPFMNTNRRWGNGAMDRMDEMENKEVAGSQVYRFASSPKAVALFSALLFVSHPVQTQAVTYIVQRLTSLSTMFYLGSLVLYVKWRLINYYPPPRKGGGTSLGSVLLYCTAVLSSILAMFTKQIAFTLPVVIALYEFFFFIGKAKRRLIYLAPLLFTIVIIPLTMIDVDRPLQEVMGDAGEKTRIADMPRLDYILTEFRVITTYIRLLFIPLNQNLYYDYPLYHSFLELPVFLSFLFLFLIFCLGVYCFFRSRITHHALRITAFGIFWFFITLSVESSIIPLHVIYEHRLYLPSIGVLSAVMSGVFVLLKATNRNIQTTAIFSLILIPLMFSYTAYSRNTVWKTEISLWEDVVQKSPRSSRVHNNLGNAYFQKGFVDKAVKHFRISLRQKPDNAKAQNNLGFIYFYKKGNVDKAIEHYEASLSLDPDKANVHLNLGIAYKAKGLTEKARVHLDKARQLNPAMFGL